MNVSRRPVSKIICPIMLASSPVILSISLSLSFTHTNRLRILIKMATADGDGPANVCIWRTKFNSLKYFPSISISAWFCRTGENRVPSQFQFQFRLSFFSFVSFILSICHFGEASKSEFGAHSNDPIGIPIFRREEISRAPERPPDAIVFSFLSTMENRTEPNGTVILSACSVTSLAN